MKIAMTGATGFVGRRLIARLLREGAELTALGRSRSRELPAAVRFFAWDAMAGEPPAESLEDVEAVIHLAGEPVAQRWSDEAKRRIRESRVTGTRHLVQGLSKLSRRPAVLVSASATGFYGDRGDEVLTEGSQPGTGFLPQVCIAWERETHQAQELGLRTVAVRTGIVLGEEGGALRKMLPAFRLGAGATLGSGEQWMSWIHVDDLISLYLFALRGAVSGAVNGTAPNPVRNSEFTETLAEALHRPAFVRAPEFALHVLFGEMAEILLGSQRVTVERAAGFRFAHPVLREALADLLA